MRFDPAPVEESGRLRRVARRLLIPVGVVVGLWALALGVLLLTEERQVFPRIGTGPASVIVPPTPWGRATSEHRVRSTDGVTVDLWTLRADTGTTAPWVLFCHGNNENLATGGRRQWYADVHAAGVNLVAFDYRGYGRSTDVTPTEKGVVDDAEAAYRFLRDSLRVPPGRIVLHGHSLGGAVCAALAERVRSAAAGLVLEGTFRSVPAEAQRRFPVFPIARLAGIRFPTEERLPSLRLPLLVLHAADDYVIPIVHGRRLYAVANAPKRMVELVGGHSGTWVADSARYFGAWTPFVRAVTSPAGTRGTTGPMPR